MEVEDREEDDAIGEGNGLDVWHDRRNDP
jgi:hypothetical protein